MKLTATRLTTLVASIRNIAKIFTPLRLFGTSDQGVFYDPSDFKPDWRYNLLSRTEEFDNNAVYNTTSGVTVVANNANDPLGGTTADTATFTGSSFRYQGYASTEAGVPFIYSVWVSSISGKNTIGVRIANSAGTESEFSLVNLTSTPTRVSVTKTFSASPVIVFCGFDNRTAIVGGSQTTGDIIVWGASLTTAENADKPYQKITDGIQDYYTYQAQPVLFQDSAGTTPVTALEQPVGLMLDKSKGLVLGPELVVNGTFDSGTAGWTIAANSTFVASSGVATFTRGAFEEAASTGFACVVGRSYRVTATLVSTSGTARLGFTGLPNTLSSANSNVLQSATPQTISVVLAAASTTMYFGVSGGVNGTTVTIDNISVRELPGNHATQPTATSRPVVSARVNLLTKTEQFDDAVWPKVDATVTANAATAPDGTNTADKFIASATNANHLLNRVNGIPVTAGTSYTFSIYAKASEYGFIRLQIQAANFPETWANFNLINGVTGLTAGTVATSIELIDDGWYRCSVTATATGTGNSGVQPFVLDSNRGNASPAYLGDGTSGIYIWGADLRVANDGVGIPSYQRVNTATDYDSVGFPTYLRFDGVDDFIQTGLAVSTLGLSLCCGYRATSNVDINQRVLVISDNSGDVNNLGVISNSGNTSQSSIGYRWPENQTAFYPAHTSGSSVGSYQRATTTSQQARLNAINGSLNVAATTTFVSQLCRIGAGVSAGAISTPFNGRFYGLTIVNKLLSTTELAQLETYTNGKTRAFV